MKVSPIPLTDVKPQCQTIENYLPINKSCLFGHHTLATLQASGAETKHNDRAVLQM